MGRAEARRLLYAEQPMVAECGGGEGLPAPIVRGYVEPNLAFWTKMKEMVQLTRSLLVENNLMTEKIEDPTDRLEEYMDFCIKVSKKEIAGQELDSEEYMEISCMGSSVEWFTLSVIDPDKTLDSWGCVEGADRSIAVCGRCLYAQCVGAATSVGILTAATGQCRRHLRNGKDGLGKVYVTRGFGCSATTSLSIPLDTRYTDEEWQKRLEGRQGSCT